MSFYSLNSAMLSHTALLHPSEMGIARAVPGREQGQTGTDILHGVWSTHTQGMCRGMGAGPLGP